MRKAALAYAALGWPVIPLRGKLPAIAKDKGGRGVHDATTDTETIRKWWERFPTANIGIAMGKPSGVWALDIDPRHGGDVSLDNLERQHGPLPQTIEQVTGAGGRHYLFRWSGEPIKNRVNIAPGLDVRSTGGYIVGPPSKHPETRRSYAWMDDRQPNVTPPAIAPEWLVELILGGPKFESRPTTASRSSASTETDPSAAKVLAAEIITVSKARPGKRNDTLNRAAFKLGQFIWAGLIDRTQVEKALFDAASASGLIVDDGQSVVSATIASGIQGGIEYPRKIKPRQVHQTVGSSKTSPGSGKASSTVDIDPFLFKPSAPLPIARTFLMERYTTGDLQTLYHYDGANFMWNGRCYERADENTIRAEIYDLLDKAVRWDWKGRNVVPFDPTKKKVNDVLDALSAAANLPNTTPVPGWLANERIPDVTHPPDEILAMRNGLLHLPTLELQPPTPDFFSFNALDYSYEPGAGTAPPEWLRFLSQLFPNDQDSIDTLQEIFGHLLTADTSQQKIFMIVGPKRSGKGTIARVLTKTLSQSNVCAPTLASLAERFGLAPLIDKHAAIIADARLGVRADQAAIGERLLSISGEDSITVDRKYRGAWTGRLPIRFLLLTNELPRFADVSGALPSRLIILTLTESFFGKENLDLTSLLLAELPGILNWSIEGWKRLRKRGHFVQPNSSCDLVRDLEDLASPISTFIRERCNEELCAEVPCDDLYIAWKEWCEGQGRRPTVKSTFGRDLRTAIPRLKIVQHDTDAKKGQRFYRGIGLTQH